MKLSKKLAAGFGGLTLIAVGLGIAGYFHPTRKDRSHETELAVTE